LRFYTAIGPYKSVSRRREKKRRLRRDAAHGYAHNAKLRPCQTKVWRSRKAFPENRVRTENTEGAEEKMAMGGDFQEKVKHANLKVGVPTAFPALPGARRSLWRCQEMWYDTKVRNLTLGMVRTKIRNAQTPRRGKPGARTSRIIFDSNQLVS